MRYRAAKRNLRIAPALSNLPRMQGPRIRMRKSAALFIILAAVAVCARAQTSQMEPRREPPADYRGDGCTFFPDGDYHGCCFEHDKAYFRGGTKAERRAADDMLYQCVRAKGHKYLAPIMWMGVRIGGGAFLHRSFSWGFGQTSAWK